MKMKSVSDKGKLRGVKKCKVVLDMDYVRLWFACRQKKQIKKQIQECETNQTTVRLFRNKKAETALMKLRMKKEGSVNYDQLREEDQEFFRRQEEAMEAERRGRVGCKEEAIDVEMSVKSVGRQEEAVKRVEEEQMRLEKVECKKEATDAVETVVESVGHEEGMEAMRRVVEERMEVEGHEEVVCKKEADKHVEAASFVEEGGSTDKNSEEGMEVMRRVVEEQMGAEGHEEVVCKEEADKHVDAASQTGDEEPTEVVLDKNSDFITSLYLKSTYCTQPFEGESIQPKVSVLSEVNVVPSQEDVKARTGSASMRATTSSAGQTRYVDLGTTTRAELPEDNFSEAELFSTCILSPRSIARCPMAQDFIADGENKIRQFTSQVNEAASILGNTVEVRAGPHIMTNLFLKCILCNGIFTNLERLQHHFDKHGLTAERQKFAYEFHHVFKKKLSLRFSLKE